MLTLQMTAALILSLWALPALACDCVRPTTESSDRIIAQAYLLVRGTVVETTAISQTYGVVNDWGPSRAHIDVAYGYDQRFSGSLHVDFNRSGSNCDPGILEIGVARDFIIFKDENNALYLPDRCVDLTPEKWAELHSRVGPMQ